MSDAPTRAVRRRGPAPRARKPPAGGRGGDRDDLLAGRYRLDRRIASGASAEVWRARDERLDRTVAVKLLHRHLLPDAESRRRLAAEARATAGLTHPGIVPVHDVIEDADTVAIVLQHVEGETLAERIQRAGPLEPETATRIAAQLAAALDHAHAAGIVHRDVKPANVVLDGDGQARLLDFGIARLLDDAEARITGRDQVVGTLRYMAPEQLAGGPVDARTDLYALGLVLAEMLTGQPVFEGVAPAELLSRKASGPPALPDAPAWLRTLVERLLAPEPDDRPASARAVAMALGAGHGAPVREAVVASAAVGAGRLEAGPADAPTMVLQAPHATPATPAAPGAPATLGTPAEPTPPAEPAPPVPAERPGRTRGIPVMPLVAVLGAALLAVGALAALTSQDPGGLALPSGSSLPAATDEAADEAGDEDDVAGDGDEARANDAGGGGGGKGKAKGRDGGNSGGGNSGGGNSGRGGGRD